MSCVAISVKCPRCGKLDACADFTHSPTAAEREAARQKILDVHTQVIHARAPRAAREGTGGG